MFLHLLWLLEGHYYVHKGVPVDTMLTSCFMKIHSMFSSCLCLYPVSGLFPSSFLTKVFHEFLIPPTCLNYLVLRDLVTLIILSTIQNGTHVYMNFLDHKDLGNHLLQLCPKVVKTPVYCYETDMRSLGSWGSLWLTFHCITVSY
jgi:hypothetical protein